MKIEWLTDEYLPEGIRLKMEKAAERCPVCEGIRVPCSISVRLCSDEAIEAINSSCRNIKKSTDVLSFPTVSYPPGVTAGKCEKLLKREYDDESGNIRMILSTEDQVGIDVTIAPETVGRNGAASLRDSVFDFVDTKDEVAPPDFSDPTMYNMTGVIDGSFTDDYFKSAEVIKKGTQS